MSWKDNPIIPLQGPTGVRPKAPAVGAWQSPGYVGLKGKDLLSATQHGDWLGLRCDGLVVIDCDNQEAAQWWSAHTKSDPARTMQRKTPRGYHYLYTQTPGSPDAPAAGVFEHIDIRAGRTSQIVLIAPDYKTVVDVAPRPFDPAWLPENFGALQQDHSSDESWDEVPEGRGNNTMAAFAGAFRKQGMSPSKIAACLGAINKITMTEDPMPVEMIVEIAKSVSRYAPRPDIDVEVEE